MIGSTAYLYAEKIPMRRSIFILSVILFILGSLFGQFLVVGVFAISYILFWLMINLPITKWAKYGDFSYGMYLYAFPIQRILGQLGLSTTGPGVIIYILVAALITAVFAVLSYYLVESRFFKRGGSHKEPARQTPVPVGTPAQL